MSKFDTLLKHIQKILIEGTKRGLNLIEYQEKLETIISSISSGKISIALLGAFSDGKTTSIAGLLGQLFDNMKIDTDESSDELMIYRPKGLEDKFEFIDTPGLFGSKEREINGGIFKFSDLTIKYLSEAHIVIYVCDAKNPLKNSHRQIIFKVMRDLNKLPVSVFVINKMDDTGCDLLDEEDFRESSRIKKETLIKNLTSCLDLTEKEIKQLKICCIAADPKGIGLEYWLNHKNDYEKRSHISALRNEVELIKKSTNQQKVIDNSIIASVREIMEGIETSLDGIIKPLNTSFKKVNESCADLKVDEDNLKNDLIVARKEASNSLSQYKDSLIADVKGASLETFENTLSTTIGVSEDGISFSIVEREINFILNRLGETVKNRIQNANVKFKRSFSDQEEFLTDAAQKGVKYLNNVKISREQVFAIRDLLFKNFKFKPYQAINTAATLTKAIGWTAVGISFAIDVYSWWKKKKAIEKMENVKKEICNQIDKIFNSLDKLLSESEFFKTFGKSYLDLKKQLEEREKEVAQLQIKVDELSKYKQQVKNFWDSYAQDVQFEEI